MKEPRKKKAAGYPLTYTILDSSLGALVLTAGERGITSLDIRRDDPGTIRKAILQQHPEAALSDTPFRDTIRLLDRYLKGEEVIFDVNVDLSSETPFVRKVLNVLRAIPYGKTTSYLAVGRRLGYPMAARAVGQAVGKNPIPIIIPCHRVVREDGTLGGFSLGIEIKKRLLLLEGVKDTRLIPA